MNTVGSPKLTVVFIDPEDGLRLREAVVDNDSNTPVGVPRPSSALEHPKSKRVKIAE
jgi:hypothetical protein